MANQLDVLLEIVDRHRELPRQLRDLMVLQQPHVLGDDLLGRRPRHPEMPQLQQQALLQVARGDANRIEALQQLERSARLPPSATAPCRELLDRRDQVAIVVEVADDGFADLAHGGSSVCIESCQSR